MNHDVKTYMETVLAERDAAYAELGAAREEAARLADGWTEANRREKALEAEIARLRAALESDRAAEAAGRKLYELVPEIGRRSLVLCDEMKAALRAALAQADQQEGT